jgi:hypothetical protein
MEFEDEVEGEKMRRLKMRWKLRMRLRWKLRMRLR